MLKRPSVYLATIGLLAAVLLVMRLRREEPPAPPLVEPARAPYVEGIGARGIVESTNENVRIAPLVAGVVTSVKVEVGARVTAGDVLFEIDNRAASAQVELLRAAVREAEVALADRQDQLNRQLKLRESNVSSIDEKQRAQFATQTAAARLESARTQLRAAEVQLDLLTVHAPRDGEILQVNIRAGEHASVTAPEPAVLLGETTELQLRADVDEDNASRVRAGCEAVAYLKGQRETAIPLRFVRIEPYIVPKRSLTGQSSERVDTRVLQVIFRFSPSAQPVYVGQQMDVFLNAAAATPPPQRVPGD